MPTKGEWALIALILGAIAFAGVAIYLTRKPAAQGLSLKRIVNQHPEQKVILRNLERVELIRDSEGNLREMIIHREVSE